MSSLAKLIARALRKNMTEAERILWRHLRQKSVDGHRFRRQHPIGPFVVDFICLKEKLIVEIDGGQHAAVSSQEEARTAWLRKSGYGLIRFWNHEVKQNLGLVVEMIRLSLTKAIAPHLSPPPQGGRKEAPL